RQRTAGPGQAAQAQTRAPRADYTAGEVTHGLTRERTRLAPRGRLFRPRAAAGAPRSARRLTTTAVTFKRRTRMTEGDMTNNDAADAGAGGGAGGTVSSGAERMGDDPAGAGGGSAAGGGASGGEGR